MGTGKDHRPDLKPIVLGLEVTPEHLPILQGVEDGNKDDKMWNREWIGRLRQVLSGEQREGLAYVADSALVTKENLVRLQEEKLSFMSRLPEAFALCCKRKKQAIEGEWEVMGWLSEDSHGVVYCV